MRPNGPATQIRVRTGRFDEPSGSHRLVAFDIGKNRKRMKPG